MKKKRNLEFEKCGMKGFNYPVEDEIKKFNIDTLNCIKRKDYYLQGDSFSDNFSYVEVLVK